MNIKEKFDVMFPPLFSADPIYPYGYIGEAYKVMERGITEATCVRRSTREEGEMINRFERLLNEKI